MTYDPERDEVFYCGGCKCQQQPKEGERCKTCKKITVSWYTDRENETDALRKWKRING